MYALVRLTVSIPVVASTCVGLGVHVQFAMSEAEVDSPEKRTAILTPYCLLRSILDHLSQLSQKLHMDWDLPYDSDESV